MSEPTINEDGTAVFTLQAPVKHQGTEYTTVTLREPIVDDLDLLDQKGKSPNKCQQDFMGQLAGIPPAVFGKMKLYDFRPIQKWAAGFTNDAES